VIPLASVGCYVPSGRYPLPSTLLMTVIPARSPVSAALLLSRPIRKGNPCRRVPAGITEFYRIGGAHAIAALAYGLPAFPVSTKSPARQRLGHSSQETRRLRLRHRHAGRPTEIVVTSEAGDPTWIAADLVAQAEHDPDAIAIFITTQPLLANPSLLK